MLSINSGWDKTRLKDCYNEVDKDTCRVWMFSRSRFRVHFYIVNITVSTRQGSNAQDDRYTVQQNSSDYFFTHCGWNSFKEFYTQQVIGGVSIPEEDSTSRQGLDYTDCIQCEELIPLPNKADQRMTQNCI